MSLDTADLKQRGVQVVRGFFPPDQAADLARRAQEVMAGVAAGTLTRDNQFALGLDSAWFEPVYRQPALVDLVASLLGPDLCLSTWRVLMKDGHFNGPISVHQDWAYFGGDTRKINVFVPLTRVHPGNGGLVFFEQSHQLGPVDRGAIDVGRYPYLVETCPELEVGDILLADFLTWHASIPAQAAEPRIMIQLVYQPASDPSSKNLVAGQITNRRNCPNRLEPLMEPLTQVSCLVARDFLAAGDKVRAERFARGALASDPGNAEAALLIHDLLAARGDPHAAHYLDLARQSLARLTADLAARSPAPPPAEAPRPPGLRQRLARRLAAR